MPGEEGSCRESPPWAPVPPVPVGPAPYDAPSPRPRPRPGAWPLSAGEAAGGAGRAAAHPERTGEGAAGAPGGERPATVHRPTPRPCQARPPPVTVLPSGGQQAPWVRAWPDAQRTRQKGLALVSSGLKRLPTPSLTQHGYREAQGPRPEALPSSGPPWGPPGPRRAGPQLSFIIRSSLAGQTKLFAAAGTESVPPLPHSQATSA